jgi:hypothetical protein
MYNQNNSTDYELNQRYINIHASSITYIHAETNHVTELKVKIVI